jgi:putative acetyltransferase
VIRQAKTGDFGKLIVLWRASAEQSHPFVPMGYWEELIDEMRQVRLPFSDTSVFEENGHVRGFISQLDGFILALYVDPAAQCRGIGLSLLDHAKSHSEHLELEVFSENHGAVAFYRREQFEVTGTRDDPSGHTLTQMKWRNDV